MGGTKVSAELGSLLSAIHSDTLVLGAKRVLLRGSDAMLLPDTWHLAPGCITPGHLASGCLAPGCLAPGHLAPGHLAPGLLAHMLLPDTWASSTHLSHFSPGCQESHTEFNTL